MNKVQRLSTLVPLFLAATFTLAQTAPSPTAKSTQGASPTTGEAAAHPSTPAHPITAAQAHELMQLTGTDKAKSRLIEQITTYMQQRFPPFVPADVKEDVHGSLEKMDVDAPSVAIYQKYLSTEDAGKIIEFYKTPAGKNYTEVQPALLNELQQSTLKQGQQTFQAAMERHKTEIETAEKKYQADHPAPSLGGPQGPAPTTAPPRSSSPSTGSNAPKSSAPSGGSSSTPTKPQ